MYNIYYNRLGTTRHNTVFVVLRKSINYIFSKILITLEVLRGIFEIAFKLFHLLANSIFQVFSMQFVIYIVVLLCAHIISVMRSNRLT